ncbi:ras-related protein Rab-26 isoform X2 [Hyperolius riggenbachi]|uniref:ras-related protein Rab-26 isoform X2 n=1 Tax=Hyperolius riggenbachi TaxID=752182 RepID=UPI0035A2ACD4
MSRKKSQKSKGSSSPASCSVPATKANGKGGTECHSNGMVMSGRPSLSNSGEFYDIAFKVMLVGDSGVGKTCLLVRFKDGAFLAGSFISTVGIDFRAPPTFLNINPSHPVTNCAKTENSTIDNNKVLNVDGVKVKLQIWDTAGQERFRSVTHAYYRDAHALLLLYDVTSKSSFDNIQAWLTEIHEYAQKDVVIMLLGNKEYGVPFMETSAKSGLNVDLAFMAIAKELKHRSMKLPNEPKFKLHDYVKKEVKGSGCCKS